MSGAATDHAVQLRLPLRLVAERPLWRAMSDRLCPRCAIRYLPLAGACACETVDMPQCLP